MNMSRDRLFQLVCQVSLSSSERALHSDGARHTAAEGHAVRDGHTQSMPTTATSQQGLKLVESGLLL
jgi:hypothetical protein